MTPFRKKILLAVTALWLVAVSCGRPQRQVQYFFLNDYHTIDNYKRISDTFNPQSGKKVLVGRAVLIYLLEMNTARPQKCPTPLPSAVIPVICSVMI